MKLLLDQNLSHKLVPALSDSHIEARHIKDFALVNADDDSIWSFAADGGFTIVSKDADFMHRALVRGHPPKVIYLRLGNCSTETILQRLLGEAVSVERFVKDPVESLFVIG